MMQLLNKTPELRLGGSYAALKANAWFEKFDWVYCTVFIFRMSFLIGK